jgi:hypothetical protein
VGQNLDSNAGVDLLKAGEVRELYRYALRCKPLVVAMASSYGGLGGPLDILTHGQQADPHIYDTDGRERTLEKFA